MSFLWVSLLAATLQNAAALAPGAAILSGPGLAACLHQVPVAEPSPLGRSLLALAPDPPPRKLTNDKHYLISNERRLDIFEEDIHGVGGVYLGVGAGQNYMMAGWARPDLMVLIDFDQDVVDLHAIYALFFAYAATPEQFAALWTDEGRKTAESVIDLGEFSRARQTRLIALYRRARRYVAKHHALMFEKMAAHETRWFLDDPEQYDHIADLVRRGQVAAHRGDFTKPGVMKAVGAVLTEANADLRTLYLSNIEMYFMYGKAYKANMLGLPLTEKTVVLRTLPAVPAGWEYIVQTGDNFHRWVGHERTWSVYTIRGPVPGKGKIPNHKHRVTDEPPRRRKHAGRRKTG